MVGLRRSDGFTLVELLVVFAIMGLLLALASPRVQTVLPALELSSAARDMAAGLREARARALREGRPVAFTLDLEDHAYTVGSDDGAVALPENVALDVVTVAEDVDRVRQRASFRFFPDGTALGGRITISRDGGGHEIDIDWMTGRVRIDAEG